MVDALKESARVLVQGGTLLDLRPISGKNPIDVVTAASVTAVVELDTFGAAADDIAANDAVRHALTKGWFLLKETSHFDFELYWDSVEEMESSLRQSRRLRDARIDHARLESRLRERSVEGPARICCHRTMMLNVCLAHGSGSHHHGR